VTHNSRDITKIYYALKNSNHLKICNIVVVVVAGVGFVLGVAFFVTLYLLWG